MLRRAAQAMIPVKWIRGFFAAGSSRVITKAIRAEGVAFYTPSRAVLWQIAGWYYKQSGLASKPSKTESLVRPQRNPHESPRIGPSTRAREPCDQKNRPKTVSCPSAPDGRGTRSPSRTQTAIVITSDAGSINQDTMLTTDYSTAGRKSGSDGAHTSATAADAPSRDPTAASRSRAARAGDSTHG